MKVRDDMVLRKIGDTYAIFPIGEALNHYNRIIKVNESSAFLYDLLSTNKSEEDLVQALIAEYEIDEDTAKNAVKAFLTGMSECFDKNFGKEVRMDARRIFAGRILPNRWN